MSAPIEEPDVHFGTDEEMLEWANKEGLTPILDENGDYDWKALYYCVANPGRAPIKAEVSAQK